MPFLKQLPAVFLVGKTNTFKTFLSSLAVASLGTNADQLCCYDDITEAAVRSRFVTTAFPLVYNDPSDAALVGRMVSACHQVNIEVKSVLRFQF